MTAEVAVMNKSAVALAADSVITVTHPETENKPKQVKTYDTTNKLFSLSKHHPVGVMIFGDANFMGVPWETVIKYYREQLGNNFFNSLNEYSNDFFDFLKTNEDLFDEEAKKTFSNNLAHWLVGVYRYCLAYVEYQLEASDIPPSESLPNVVDSIINSLEDLEDISEEWLECDYLNFENEFIEFAENLNEVVDGIFIDYEVSPESHEKLLRIWNLMKRKPFFEISNVPPFEDYNYSGVIICGFGDNEIFPKLETYKLDGTLENTLRYVNFENKSVNITQNNESAVIGFAQEDMVHRFMEGVDPIYQGKITELLYEILNMKFEELNIENQENIIEDILEDFNTGSFMLSQREFWGPTIQALKSLPKTELTDIAQSLIQLTSLERKVSREKETVGEPIDVAVISKGDGFIWTERKHYFDPELNHRFFENYFSAGGNENG